MLMASGSFPRKLEELPDEILLRILTFLDPLDVPSLHLTCHKIRKVALDNNHWRFRTFDDSTFLETLERKRTSAVRFIDSSADSALHGPHAGAEAVPSLANHARPSGQGHRRSQAAGEDPGDTVCRTEDSYPHYSQTEARKRWRQKAIANWDPSFPNEHVLWYNEYIQRYAPSTTNWLQQPRIRDGNIEDILDARGVALYTPPEVPDAALAVSPLDDGSVCLWDLKGRRGVEKGSIVGHSQPGILHIDSPGVAGRSRKIDSGVTECISVDSHRKRAFVAVQGHLMEVDLETLQVVSDQSFEWSIAALSSASPDVPLTVGTSLGIHLYDYRARLNPAQTGAHQTLDSDPLPQYTPLSQPHPQSVLHLPNAGQESSVSHDIYVAGRFTSILHYDRRKIGGSSPIVGTIYTGSRLSSLASLPYRFSPSEHEVRRNGEMTPEKVRVSKAKDGRTLIAGGEYNNKGSLEVYGLPPVTTTCLGGSRRAHETNSATKNRYNAADSKILSVATHGTRIVFSDGSGYVKWFERDGTTEVRRHRIGHSEMTQRPSLFSAMPAMDDLARKVLSTGTPAGREMVNDDEVLFWTGEKLGLISFTGQPGFQAEDFEKDPEQTQESEELARAEQEYEERMRVALERQAEDVRIVRDLGLGPV